MDPSASGPVDSRINVLGHGSLYPYVPDTLLPDLGRLVDLSNFFLYDVSPVPVSWDFIREKNIVRILLGFNLVLDPDYQQFNIINCQSVTENIFTIS